MKPLCIGKNIAALRKRKHWTQATLAEKLNISDKTISKWESGSGFPDISQLPRLAQLFNTSIDYLMLGDTSGITIAGSILVDTIKIINEFPDEGFLADIEEIQHAVGGCVPNTIINLRKMDRYIPLSAAGMIGDDENGRFILSELQKYSIDSSGVRISSEDSTSYSDVMSAKETGNRTFFHYKGANRHFSPKEIDLDALNCKLFHIGYLLLLDAFDETDGEVGTVMARFLKTLQGRGIKTSIDLVSTVGDRFCEVVTPSLPYINYAVMNEIEACRISGLKPRNKEGGLMIRNLIDTLHILMQRGVRDLAVIHCPEAGFALSREGELTYVPSLALPPGFIKGSTGAGDAFCAACLYGFYHHMEVRRILEFASCASACCLSAPDSISGMKSMDKILEMNERYQRQKNNYETEVANYNAGKFK